jgi:hypothetical protein
MTPPLERHAIPEEWIKKYVDQLLGVAGKLEPGLLRDAVLIRADQTMDLVKAWRESQKIELDTVS